MQTTCAGLQTAHKPTGNALRLLCLVLFLSALFLTSSPAFCEEPAPRAEAIATARHLAESTDSALQTLPRLAFQVGGLRWRTAAEYALAMLCAALNEDGLAGRHWRAMDDGARLAGDEKVRATALIAQLYATFISGDYEHGQRLNDQLAQIASSINSERISAIAEEYQGVRDRRRGLLDHARDKELRALWLYRRIGDAAGEATVLTNLGTIARDKGDFAQCLDYYLQALAIRERIDVRLSVAYRNLALLYRELGDTQTTRHYFEQALEASHRHFEPEYYASVIGSFAAFLNDAGEFDHALDNASEALAISTVLGDRPSMGFEQLEIGRALLGEHRTDEAAMHFVAAQTLGQAIQQRELIVRSKLSLAEIALAQGDLSKSHRMVDEVFPHLDRAGLKPYLAQAYSLSDRIAEAEHQPKVALEFARRHARLHEELLGVRSSRLLAAIEIRKVREQSQQQLDLAERTNELQTERIEHSRRERNFGMIAIAALILTLAIVTILLVRLKRLNRALLMHNEQFERQRGALIQANRQLERQTHSLYRATITDALTGAGSRSHVLGELARLLTECQSQHRSLTVLLIDFDHFKQVNDRFGHLAGDRVLATASHIIADELTPECLFGRFGGEEFLVAFADRDARASADLAERLRLAVAERMAAMQPSATVSIGGAMLQDVPSIQSIDPLLDAADRALYRAKLDGRNRISGFEPA